jgi:hypothetical protein
MRPAGKFMNDDFGSVAPFLPVVVMLREGEGGASSSHRERSCLLDRPLARAMTKRLAIPHQFIRL